MSRRSLPFRSLLPFFIAAAVVSVIAAAVARSPPVALDLVLQQYADRDRNIIIRCSS